MSYTKNQIRELSALYNINLNTLLSQQKNGKQAVDLVVIKNICTDKKVTLEQFLKLFEDKTLTDRIKELELSILEYENENERFFRELISKIRKYWWGN